MTTSPQGSTMMTAVGAPTNTTASADREAAGETTRALNRGSVALISDSGLAAGLGALYWLIAAHLFSAADVGRASALVAALMASSQLAQLNSGRSLSWLIPRARHGARHLLARTYAVTGVASAVFGLTFALGAPVISRQFAYLRSSPWFAVGFAASVVLYTMFTLEDTVLAAARRPWVIPVEKGAFGLLKIPVLVAVSATVVASRSLPIFFSWVGPLVVVVIPVNLYIFTRGLPRAEIQAVPPVARENRSLVRLDFAGTMFLLVGTLPLAVLILAFLGPVSAAAFYVPLTVASALDLLSLNLGNVLTAEIARGGGHLRDATLRFVRRVWSVVGLLSVGFLILAPEVLRLFGAEYRDLGTGVFRLMMLAVLPRSAMFLSIAVARGLGRGRLIVAIQATACVGTIGLSVALLPSFGLAGMGLAWLVGSAAAGGIAAAFTLLSAGGRARLVID